MRTYTNVKSSSKKITGIEFIGGFCRIYKNIKVEGTLCYWYKKEYKEISGEFYATSCKNGKDVIIHEFLPDSDKEFRIRIKGALL